MSGARIQGKSAVLSPARGSSFYQRLIHRVFVPMRLGRLTMHLPDGEVVLYGEGAGGPEAQIFVRRPVFFKRCALFGDVGFGEAYVDGDWDTPDITKVVEWMIANVANHPTMIDDRDRWRPVNFLKVFNKIRFAWAENSLPGSRRNIAGHYDLGNDFFRLFLDPGMTYSSAYFKKSGESLQEAQANKYDQLCRNIRLKETDHLLEIGCGWGGFALHAARQYGCLVTAITISRRQYEYARDMIQREGLSRRVEILLQDYRSLTGKFDKVVSIEMIEAVGHKYLPVFFQCCHQFLKKDGILGLQMILSPDHRYDNFRKNVDWIQKHIFPGSLLPSMEAVLKAIRASGDLGLFDYRDLTPHYAQTLAFWRANFNAHLDEVKRQGFDEAFIRKWNYYWSYCEAAFHMRNITVVQAVFSRPNNLQLDV